MAQTCKRGPKKGLKTAGNRHPGFSGQEEKEELNLSSPCLGFSTLQNGGRDLEERVVEDLFHAGASPTRARSPAEEATGVHCSAVYYSREDSSALNTPLKTPSRSARCFAI
ncbi:hypothetical protein CAPTEDRAFT_215432 [Capitella teleta]|uniref:Uncharacterized protein n=1 Tax=Capitella teleta TaxID=283909 RepID=R7TZB1_CAPTE|nr:hypothetical protein CAPTEDRAFT_215432 [Capitella teleta]|eukprot:ELT99104.1 hypothetical protein CAPTEDRAFT_215432 [Capitella teleta]